jgi:hypothetical protein
MVFAFFFSIKIILFSGINIGLSGLGSLYRHRDAFYAPEHAPD